jgi:hypothetical protein
VVLKSVGEDSQNNGNRLLPVRLLLLPGG